MGLTIEQIKNASKPKIKELYVEEFDGNIYLRALNARTVVDLQTNCIVNGKPLESYYIKMVMLSVCTATNELVYDYEDVAGMDAVLYNKLTLAIAEFNGMDTNAVQKAQEALKADPFVDSASS